MFSPLQNDAGDSAYQLDAMFCELVKVPLHCLPGCPHLEYARAVTITHTHTSKGLGIYTVKISIYTVD